MCGKCTGKRTNSPKCACRNGTQYQQKDKHYALIALGGAALAAAGQDLISR